MHLPFVVIQEKTCSKSSKAEDILGFFDQITSRKCFPPTTSDQLYFLCVYKVWSMIYHFSVGRVQNKYNLVPRAIFRVFFAYSYSEKMRCGRGWNK